MPYLMTRRFSILAFVSSLLLCAAVVSAHTTGLSWQKEVGGGYTVDIGYDPPDLTTATPERFDFLLRDKVACELHF